jgi:hypothetical protein
MLDSDVMDEMKRISDVQMPTLPDITITPPKHQNHTLHMLPRITPLL